MFTTFDFQLAFWLSHSSNPFIWIYTVAASKNMWNDANGNDSLRDQKLHRWCWKWSEEKKEENLNRNKKIFLFYILFHGRWANTREKSYVKKNYCENDRRKELKNIAYGRLRICLTFMTLLLCSAPLHLWWLRRRSRLMAFLCGYSLISYERLLGIFKNISHHQRVITWFIFVRNSSFCVYEHAWVHFAFKGFLKINLMLRFGLTQGRWNFTALWYIFLISWSPLKNFYNLLRFIELK